MALCGRLVDSCGQVCLQCYGEVTRHFENVNSNPQHFHVFLVRVCVVADLALEWNPVNLKVLISLRILEQAVTEIQVFTGIGALTGAYCWLSVLGIPGRRKLMAANANTLGWSRAYLGLTWTRGHGLRLVRPQGYGIRVTRPQGRGLCLA